MNEFRQGDRYTPEQSELIAKTAGVISTACTMLSLKILGEKDKGDRCRAAHIHINCISGGVHGIAALVGSHPTKKPKDSNWNPNDFVNPVSLLFAGLLIAKGLSFDGSDADSTIATAEIGPEIFSEILEIVENLTGKPADGYIDSGLLEAARKWQQYAKNTAALANGMMDNLLNQRKTVQ